MRIAYLDCFAGIAGDMFLGALLDAGVPLAVLADATHALDLNASLRVETVDRSGISCTKVHVLEGNDLAEQLHDHTHQQPDRTYTPQPQTQHQHKTGHPHTHEFHTNEHTPDEPHDHPHTHGRSLTQIVALITAAPLAAPVKATALRAFDLLGHSEAKIHNVPVDDIHFHEVGAVDAIVDIVAAAAGIHHLAIGAWYCSPLNVGGGMVQCAHGTFPVPAPATADLLRGLPTYSAHIEKELVTPTGAALLRALTPNFGPQPAMTVEAIGYGAGTRNPKDFPNVLRLSIGTASTLQPTDILKVSSRTQAAGRSGETRSSNHHDSLLTSPTPELSSRPTPELSSRPTPELSSRPIPELSSQPTPELSSRPESSQSYREDAVERPAVGPATTPTPITVLETALDDLSPQLIAYVAESALAQGALDVMLTPVIMKKGRPGTLLTLLCDPAHADALTHLLLTETSTLGVRRRTETRTTLDRAHQSVNTPYGDIRIKIGSLAGTELNLAPEFEDCRAAALHHNVPLKQVQQAALTAYLK